mgnify:CR=1 FL=1
MDAGNSSDHVEKFYNGLRDLSLKLPDFTVITHWHWDHTFGMHASSGKTVACHLTSEKLIEFAKAEGGSEATLKAAYADKAKWTAVRDDLVAGQLLGVTVTPGLFYNGYFLTPEGLPLDNAGFEKSMRAMLQTG